jgi:hypothetical protein
MKRSNLLTALLLLLITTTSFAQPFGKGNRMKMDPDMNLSENQLDQITIIQDEAKIDCVDLKADVEKSHLLLNQMLRSDADLKSLEKQADQVSQMKNKALKARLAVNREIRSLLNDDQKRVFDSKYNKALRGPGGKGNRQLNRCNNVNNGNRRDKRDGNWGRGPCFE